MWVMHEEFLVANTLRPTGPTAREVLDHNEKGAVLCGWR